MQSQAIDDYSRNEHLSPGLWKWLLRKDFNAVDQEGCKSLTPHLPLMSIFVKSIDLKNEIDSHTCKLRSRFEKTAK